MARVPGQTTQPTRHPIEFGPARPFAALHHTRVSAKGQEALATHGIIGAGAATVPGVSVPSETLALLITLPEKTPSFDRPQLKPWGTGMGVLWLSIRTMGASSPLSIKR